MDLGERKLITSVATQGYRGSGQYVIDYNIKYSNDNSTFVPIVNALGDPEVSGCTVTVTEVLVVLSNLDILFILMDVLSRYFLVTLMMTGLSLTSLTTQLWLDM